MDSKTVLLAILCLLGMVLLVHGNGNETLQRDEAEPRSMRRIKRMYVMCPPNFKRIGNECYYISPNKLNWLDAYFECKDANSKLAEPMKYEDKHIRKYLLKNKQTDDLWIGGTFNWKSNKWQWGHNGREIEYQSFSQMVPGWSAEECTKKINFICQHRMPLVSETGRLMMYDKWNKTYPYQKANEKMVYIVNEPNNRNRSETGKPRIYNSVKRVLQYNPSVKPRPLQRRPNRPKKVPGNARPFYIPPDFVGRKQHVAQYAPDAQNDINTIDNGGHHNHRNGYTSMSQFNIDFSPRNGKNRDASFPRGHRLGHGAGHVEPRQPHQHRHQPGLHRTTKRTHHPLPTYPQYVASNTMPPATTTTTTTTTTPPPPPPMPPTRPAVTTTMRAPFFPPATTIDMKYSSQVLTTEEKKAKRERLRERLKKLTPEEQRLFFQDREKRKRQKEQQLLKQQHQRDNEVVQ
uniref:C-type lectin domain-containing protein n=1 Tax=Anopheles dirus TaxID=7168 RepID=A0A182NJ81_9DIPT